MSCEKSGFICSNVVKLIKPILAKTKEATLIRSASDMVITIKSLCNKTASSSLHDEPRSYASLTPPNAYRQDQPCFSNPTANSSKPQQISMLVYSVCLGYLRLLINSHRLMIKWEAIGVGVITIEKECLV